MTCRFCERPVAPAARAQLYDYCKRDDCVRRALRERDPLIAVPTHKSIPMLLPPGAYRAGEHLDARRNR